MQGVYCFLTNFFVSWKSYVPFSRYSSFCIFNHPVIYQICDVMRSISTGHRVYFWIYLLNHNSLTHQSWSINRYKQGEYFSEIFWTIWRTGAKFQAVFNLAICSNYSISTTKNWQTSLYCQFIKIIKGPGTSLQSLASGQKHVRNVCYKIH